MALGPRLSGVYSYELTKKDVAEIVSSHPDMLLLVGGTDGGNSECILANARKLSQVERQLPGRHCR